MPKTTKRRLRRDKKNKGPHSAEQDLSLHQGESYRWTNHRLMRTVAAVYSPLRSINHSDITCLSKDQQSAVTKTFQGLMSSSQALARGIQQKDTASLTAMRSELQATELENGQPACATITTTATISPSDFDQRDTPRSVGQYVFPAVLTAIGNAIILLHDPKKHPITAGLGAFIVVISGGLLTEKAAFSDAKKAFDTRRIDSDTLKRDIQSVASTTAQYFLRNPQEATTATSGQNQLAVPLASAQGATPTGSKNPLMEPLAGKNNPGGFPTEEIDPEASATLTTALTTSELQEIIETVTLDNQPSPYKKGVTTSLWLTAIVFATAIIDNSTVTHSALAALALFYIYQFVTELKEQEKYQNTIQELAGLTPSAEEKNTSSDFAAEFISDAQSQDQAALANSIQQTNKGSRQRAVLAISGLLLGVGGIITLVQLETNNAYANTIAPITAIILGKAIFDMTANKSTSEETKSVNADELLQDVRHASAMLSNGQPEDVNETDAELIPLTIFENDIVVMEALVQLARGVLIVSSLMATREAMQGNLNVFTSILAVADIAALQLTVVEPLIFTLFASKNPLPMTDYAASEERSEDEFGLNGGA